MSRIGQWFRTVWGKPHTRRAAIGGYLALKAHPHTLADIALRGRIGRTSHVPNDPSTTAFNEGRRSLALEILELAEADARKLLALVDPTPERKD